MLKIILKKLIVKKKLSKAKKMSKNPNWFQIKSKKKFMDKYNPKFKNSSYIDVPYATIKQPYEEEP